MQRASTCIHLVAEEETETEIEKEIYQETEPGLRLNVQRAGYADKLELGGESPLTMRHGHWRSSNILWALDHKASRKIGIWRRVAADNALRTAGGHSISFGPLDRNCVGYIE